MSTLRAPTGTGRPPLVKGLLVTASLVATLTGCASREVAEGPAPDFSYSFIVDERVAKTVAVPGGTRTVSVVVQPRSGESPIWQNYGATYAYIVLQPRERELTPSGGRTLDVRGTIRYYRDLKMIQEQGFDVVTRGKPVGQVDAMESTVTVEPGTPVQAPLAEGIQVEITLVPKGASGP